MSWPMDTMDVAGWRMGAGGWAARTKVTAEYAASGFASGTTVVAINATESKGCQLFQVGASWGSTGSLFETSDAYWAMSMPLTVSVRCVVPLSHLPFT
jgi:hypothetical protein